MFPGNYAVEIPGSCSLKSSESTEVFTTLKCFGLPIIFFKRDLETRFHDFYQVV